VEDRLLTLEEHSTKVKQPPKPGGIAEPEYLSFWQAQARDQISYRSQQPGVLGFWCLDATVDQEGLLGLVLQPKACLAANLPQAAFAITPSAR
jgi:hypothetical protein